MTLLRLCIAKRDETLAAAAERLQSFAARMKEPVAGISRAPRQVP
jgi:hypothetical protein